MRQLVTLPTEHDCAPLCDFLNTLGIQTHVEQIKGLMTVWILDEDDWEKARRGLRDFQQNLRCELRHADIAAESISTPQQTASLDHYSRSTQRIRSLLQQLLEFPVVALLIGLVLWTAMISRLGLDERIASQFQMSALMRDDSSKSFVSPGLWQVMARWEFLRWISPVLLHRGPVHLIANGLTLLLFGSVVESRSGSWRFVLMVIVIALCSNFAQMALHGPEFCGLSGVNFGLIGFLGAKHRYAPDYGASFTVQSGVWVLLFSGLSLMSVSMSALHFAGLMMGIVLAMLPLIPRIARWWKSRFRNISRGE